MHPVEQYLKQLQEIYQTGGGTSEESYYGALETLLNEVGRKLKPKIRCVSQPRNIGAGEPDFGLYTVNQFQRAKDVRPVNGILPERGVIEVKGWSDDSFLTAQSEQVSKYWDRYGLVLVTNYRDFVLVGRDDKGRPVRLESYRMAESANTFHALLGHPRKTADEQGGRLVEFLSRVMLHAAPLTDPEDLAWFLASYAREARSRVESAADLPALEGLKKGLEEALGMKFEGDKGEHFFRATLVQTLFYGVFSSWVLWCRENWGRPDASFSWHEAQWTLHVPMVKGLFDQIATPTKLKPLGVDEVLDWAGLVLNRVDRVAFFQKFEEEHAVQYFYEPFLKAYDPELRKELGVWFTPPEIVTYQVERVDRVLREELSIADGMADDQVVIVDLCCGTGAYLVESLRRIYKTLIEKGGSALIAQKLKKAAMERVFGFEILPAPFVVSHLQIGLMLRQLGAPLDPDSDERAGVYLTNALTGWEPPKQPKNELPLFPELLEERDAANRVKREFPILVFIGNPPYNAFAGTSPEEEGGLVEPYKEGLTKAVKDGGWGIKKFNLDDLYVRFFRIAERRIVKSGKGVVSFISNYSWSSEPSFVVMRKRLLESFDKFWIENMHGNRKISEYAPDGRTSETVFAIPGSSPGIQQGVVISLWVRRENHKDRPDELAKVLYRDDIDAAKAEDRRQQLLDSLNLKQLDRKYQTSRPAVTNRFSFRPESVSNEYRSWPAVCDLSKLEPQNGPIERRANALVSIDKCQFKTLALYLDSKVNDEEIARIEPRFMRSSGEFKAKKARTLLKDAVNYSQDKICHYPFKPFDVRYAYLDANLHPLFSRPNPILLAQRFVGNSYIVVRETSVNEPKSSPFYFSYNIVDYHMLSVEAKHIPILLVKHPEHQKTKAKTRDMFNGEKASSITVANLSQSAIEYVKQLGTTDPDKDAETAGVIWMHALATGYSPLYLSENADGIRQDWPRIPLPNSKKALLKSAELGRRVAALLDTEKPVDGVSCGDIRPELRSIAVISKVGGGSLNPNIGELDMTAGWGHGGKDGVCMPGKGKIIERKQSEGRLEKLFGGATLDIYLNDVAYWTNVPRSVWDYHIGGYQVIKKWLSYREKTMLGRGLKVEEAEYVTEMARRIASLILLQPDLDANYVSIKNDTWHWLAVS